MPLLVTQTNYDIIGTFLGASEGTNYVDNIPALTRDNITTVGNAILDYQPAKEAFYNSFLTKITKQLFDGVNASNRFKFLKGATTAGDIEDSYVDYIEGENFEGSGLNSPFARKLPKIKVLYHKIDREMFYKITVSDEQLRKAMLSPNGLSILINKVVDTLTQSADFDEYVMFKQLLLDTLGKEHPTGVLADPKDNGSEIIIYPVVEVIEGTTKSALVANFLYALKKHSQNMTFNTRDYNMFEVLNATSYDNQIIVMHKDYSLDIDMSVLANTFNVDKMKLDGKVIIVDDFNDSATAIAGYNHPSLAGTEKLIGVIFDRRGVQFWDALRKMETLRNPQSLYTNYWLHIWQGLSYAYFHNIVFILEPAALTAEGAEGNE